MDTVDQGEDYNLFYEKPQLNNEDIRKLLIGSYDYYSKGQYLQIVLYSLFSVLTPITFISAVYLLIWFLTNYFHVVSFTIITLIVTVPLLIHRIILLRYYFTYRTYFRDNGLTSLSWDEIIEHFERQLNLTKPEINTILYFKQRLIKRIFELGILRRLWTKIMYWQLNSAIIEPMVSGNNSLNFLKIRCRIYGLIYLVLSPIFLIILVLYGLLKYGATTKYNPSLLQLKDWTYLAKNKLRGESEPYWEVIERLNDIRGLVEIYEDKPYSSLILSILRFLRLVVASHLGILVVVSLNNPELLLIYNYLPWIIFVLSTVLSFLQQKLQRQKTQHNLEETEQELGKHLNTEEIPYFYQYRIIIFLLEILSVFLTPLLLIFYFPSKINIINSEVSTLSQIAA